MHLYKTMKIHTKKGDIILDDDSPYASYSWNVNSRGYARRLMSMNGKRVDVFLHRLVSNAKPKEIVDHINRNKLDNRQENLRIVTSLMNCLNRNKNIKKSSKYKGVAKHRCGWQVYVNGKYLGLFKSEIEAAMAYDSKVVEVFGNVAPTNKELGLL